MLLSKRTDDVVVLQIGTVESKGMGCIDVRGGT